MEKLLLEARIPDSTIQELLNLGLESSLDT